MPDRASPREATDGSPNDAAQSGDGPDGVKPSSSPSSKPASAGPDASFLLGQALDGVQVAAAHWGAQPAGYSAADNASTAFSGPLTEQTSPESSASAAESQESGPSALSEDETQAASAAAPNDQLAAERGIFGLGRALKSAVRALTRDKPAEAAEVSYEADESVDEEQAPSEPYEEPILNPPEDSHDRPAGLSGHTSTVAMPEVLGFLAQLRKSGTLWIWNEREQFRVQLDEGNVIFARSESPRQGSLLGEILVSQGALDAMRFEKFLRQPRAPGPLGDALLQAGLVSKQALSGAIQYQAQRVFNRAYGLEDAYFRFDGSQEPEQNTGIRLSVTHMLFESARSRDESEQRLESVLGDPFEGQ
jgi:hypothetical protein